MKYLIYSTLILFCSYGVVQSAELKEEIIGSWKSNRELTLPELDKSKVLSKEQIRAVNGLIGTMELHIHPGIAITKMNGKLDTCRWEIVKVENGKGRILTTDGKGEQEESDIWVKDGMLYTYSSKYDFIEVFSKIKVQ